MYSIVFQCSYIALHSTVFTLHCNVRIALCCISIIAFFSNVFALHCPVLYCIILCFHAIILHCIIMATVSEGLAQDPYVAAKVGIESMTLRTKGVASTNAPSRISGCLM